MLPLSNSPLDEEPWKSSSSSVKLLEDLSICDNPTNLRTSEDQCDFLRGQKVECHLSFSSSPHSSPVKQKPPAVSKKPQISFVPPFCAQPRNGHLDWDTPSLSQADDRTEATPAQAAKEQEDNKTETQQSLESTAAASPIESAPASQDSRLSNWLSVNGDTQEEDASEEGSNSVAGSVSSKEDDNGESH